MRWASPGRSPTPSASWTAGCSWSAALPSRSSPSRPRTAPAISYAACSSHDACDSPRLIPSGVPTSTWFRLDGAKRERVLQAAMREFGEHGYSTGSLNTIAREAEIAKGSLFQYFSDKQEFFAYVCDEASR